MLWTRILMLMFCYVGVLAGVQSRTPTKKEQIDDLFQQAIKIAESNSDSSLLILDSTMLLIDPDQDSVDLCAAYNNYGLVYYYKGHMDMSGHFYQKSLSIALLLEDEKRIARTYRNIGICYRVKGLYSIAIDYYQKSLDMALANQDSTQIAALYNSIGNLFDTSQEYEKAIEYFEYAKDIWSASMDSVRLSRVHNNIGIAYSGLHLTDSAIANYSLSLRYNGLNDFALKNMGEELLKVNNITEAKGFLDHSMEIRRSNGSPNMIASVHHQYGIYFSKMGKVQQASLHLDTAINLLDLGEDLKLIRENYQIRKELALQGKEYLKVYQYDRLSDSIGELVFNKERLNLTKLEASYAVERKESERALAEEKARISLLTANQEAQRSSIRLGIIIGMTVVLVIILYVVFTVINRNKRIAQLNQKIEQQNKTIRLLAEEGHHKTKNSLQLLGAIVRTQATSTDNMEVRQELEQAWGRLETVNSVHKELLNQSMSGDAYDTTVELREYLTSVLEGSFAPIDVSLKEKIYKIQGVSIRFQMDNALYIGLIVNEIATNFLKHVYHGSERMNVKFALLDGAFKLVISDNGNGFDPSIENEESFGLKLIKTIALDLKSTLELKSDKTGTIYSFIIPLNNHEKT